jgi:hypothetical protein
MPPLRIWLDGAVEFETSDGEVRCVGGWILMVEDTIGKGHISPHPEERHSFILINLQASRPANLLTGMLLIHQWSSLARERAIWTSSLCSSWTPPNRSHLQLRCPEFGGASLCVLWFRRECWNQQQ